MARDWRRARERLEKNLKKYSMSGSWGRILLGMALMVGLSLAAVFTFARVSARSMEESVRDSLLQSVEQRRVNIDYHLRSVQRSAEELMPLIYPYVTSAGDRETQLREFSNIRSILSAYTSDSPAGARLYVPSEKIYSSQQGTFYSMDQLSEEDRDRFLSHGGLTWAETHEVPVIDLADGTRSSSSVLTCGYTMRQRSDYDRFACVLMLDVEISAFDEVLSHGGSPDQWGYLVNREGVCLAAQERDRLGQEVIPPAAMEQIRLAGFGSIRERDRAYVFDRLSYGGEWYVVMEYPAAALSMANSPQASAMGVIVMLVLMISLTMIFILAYNFIMNITLARVNVNLDALHAGWDAASLEESHSPLRRLERNADLIVSTVKDMTEKQYKDQLAITESQMKSLQAQIKPHFLYNTLDAIKWMIMDGNREEAVWMVNTLSRYLRQSITRGPGVIPLSEELEVSGTYLVIMGKRFKDRFSVSCDVEEEAKGYVLPKLLLQPLLENALLHGLLYCDKPEAELTVRGWVSQGQLYIEVEDNGAGMSEERCQALETGGSGYGVSNVRKRVMLFSGGKGAFHVSSREGMGTCVTIQLPALTEKDAPVFETGNTGGKQEDRT